MRRLLLLLLFTSLYFCSYSQENWELINPKGSTASTYLDIQFLDDNHGFIIVDYLLFETKNGGDSWERILQFSSAKQLEFFNNTGYIVGKAGLVIRTTDGGESWETLDTGLTNDLNSISFIDESTVVIGGVNSIQITTDGGISWQSLQVTLPGYQETMLTSFFQSATVGHAIGTSGNFFKTGDGGNTWKITQPEGAFRPGVGVFHFIDENLGYASGQDMELYRTEDGGETWSAVGSGGDSYFAIQFVDENVGYVAGELGILKRTMDGGTTWEWASFTKGLTLYQDIHGIYFTDPNKGFAVGRGGRIMRTYDGGDNWEQYGPFYTGISQLDFLSDDLGYALTNSTFFVTKDKGATWTNIGSPQEGQKALKFDFVNENVGYCIGGGATGTSGDTDSVYKTMDGGLSWTEKSPAFSDNLYCIDFVDENLGFVSGGFNSTAVFRTTDGGENWEKVLDQPFGTIQFINDKIGYGRRVGNAFYRIYKTIDGGSTWNIIFEIEEDINSFHFINENVGFLVGDAGLMKKTTNGGLSWDDIQVPYEYYAYVRFYSEALGYIVEDNGRIHKTDNGGLNWEVLRIVGGLSSIVFTEDNSIYLSGSGGVILRSKLDVETLEANTFAISVTDETCSGNNDGLLTIKANKYSNYIATLNGQEYYFNEQLLVDDIPPGTYDLCISLQYWNVSPQCYQYSIDPAFTFEATGSTVENGIKSKTFQMEVKKGTAPYSLLINNHYAGSYSENNFMFTINEGDFIEIYSAKPCEGNFTYSVPHTEHILAYPIPAISEVLIRIPTNLNRVGIDIFDSGGNLINSSLQPVENGTLRIAMDSMYPGIYTAVLHSETTRTLRIVKR